ncbi:hypothetical protein SELMODRAFT_419402 [Selaginella moellendorffii]|uniref:Uncharacterized protein n=1 Tax=Selaginella moellendorffii TaxID=88036 RepID=D8S8U5_SELML|nr:hypothetical protein SELMODRAFT_419402 [Selaginella moellendorffii]
MLEDKMRVPLWKKRFHGSSRDTKVWDLDDEQRSVLGIVVVPVDELGTFLEISAGKESKVLPPPDVLLHKRYKTFVAFVGFLIEPVCIVLCFTAEKLCLGQHLLARDHVEMVEIKWNGGLANVESSMKKKKKTKRKKTQKQKTKEKKQKLKSGKKRKTPQTMPRSNSNAACVYVRKSYKNLYWQPSRSKQHSYNDVVQGVAEELELDDPSQVTAHNVPVSENSTAVELLGELKKKLGDLCKPDAELRLLQVSSHKVLKISNADERINNQKCCTFRAEEWKFVYMSMGRPFYLRNLDIIASRFEVPTAQGHYVNCIECTDVNHKITRQESFYGELWIHLKVTLLCQNAKKEIYFLDFPPDLQLQLKRFEYDSTRGNVIKIYNRFPLMLDLDRERGKYLSPNADKSVCNLYVLYRYGISKRADDEQRPVLGIVVVPVDELGTFVELSAGKESKVLPPPDVLLHKRYKTFVAFVGCLIEPVCIVLCFTAEKLCLGQHLLARDHVENGGTLKKSPRICRLIFVFIP